MSEQARENQESIEYDISHAFLKGKFEGLTSLAHKLVPVRDTLPEHRVADIRALVVDKLIDRALNAANAGDKNYKKPIEHAYEVARIPVNGWQPGHYVLNHLVGAEKSLEGIYREKQRQQKGQHGYEARTQMGSP